MRRLRRGLADESAKEAKKLKKHLTNAAGCGKITNVPPKGRVPCKLNNVTNEKHQTDAFLMECRRKRGCRPGFSQLPGTATKFMKLRLVSVK